MYICSTCCGRFCSNLGEITHHAWQHVGPFLKFDRVTQGPPSHQEPSKGKGREASASIYDQSISLEDRYFIELQTSISTRWRRYRRSPTPISHPQPKIGPYQYLCIMHSGTPHPTVRLLGKKQDFTQEYLVGL